LPIFAEGSPDTHPLAAIAIDRTMAIGTYPGAGRDSINKDMPAKR